MRLKSTGKFNSADYFALQGDAGHGAGGGSYRLRPDRRRPGQDRVQDHHRRAGRDGAGLRCTDPRAGGQELADDQIGLAGIDN